ncbi:MAG: hypothetical protein J1F35_05520 [Erysipelotrichales bacterium]|nr:hypothetical protein [Erysipelotrichales bacterium]
MKKKQLDITELKKRDGETILTSELKDLGYYQYDIKELENDGYLLKLRQGHFYVNCKKTKFTEEMIESIILNEANRKGKRKKKAQDLSKIEVSEGKIINTKELKTLGYSQDDIRSIESDGYLVKVRRGYYYVNTKLKDVDVSKLEAEEQKLERKPRDKKKLDLTELAKKNEKIIPAHELKSMGFSTYDIKNLVNDELIVSARFGYYYINTEKKEYDVSIFEIPEKKKTSHPREKKQLDLAELSKKDEQYIATSELKDMNFSVYDINNLTEDGLIIKVARGYYYVNTSLKEVDLKTLDIPVKGYDVSLLEDKDEEVITTSELKDLGFTTYDIKNLENDGYLKKVNVKRGYYYVDVFRKNKNSKLLELLNSDDKDSTKKSKNTKQKKNLLDDLDKLESYEGITILNKDLKELGFEQYHIQSLERMGYLVRKGHGLYIVNLERKNLNFKLMQSLAKKLDENVNNGDYKAAYNVLVEMFNKKLDDTYDQYLYLYFTLLKPLLNFKYDFSYIDKLAVTSFSGTEELQALSNKILKNLADGIARSLEEKALVENQKKQFNASYKEFVEKIKTGDYDAALESVRNCIAYSYNEQTKEISNIYKNLILALLELKRRGKNKKPQIGVEYDNYEDLYALLNTAIINNNYAFAYKLMEEHNLSATSIYKPVKYLLGKIVTFKKDDNTNKYAQKQEIAYDLFLTYFYKNDYNKALEQLKYILDRQNPVDKKSKEYRLYILLKSYDKMRHADLAFAIKEISYEGLPTIEVFEKALDNQDFLVAYRNIGKLTQNNKNQLLNVYKIILNKMHEIDRSLRDRANEEQRNILVPKVNRAGTVPTSFLYVDYQVSKQSKPAVGARPLIKPTVKPQKVGETPKVEPKESVQPIVVPKNVEEMKEIPKEEPKVVEEVKPESKAQDTPLQTKEILPRETLEYQVLYDAIYDRKYDELFEKLEDAFLNKLQMSREEANIYRLLQMLNTLKSGKNVTPKQGYVTDKSNEFKSFYQSINLRNIEDIKYYFDCVYEKAREKDELELYGMVLNDILDEQARLEEIENIKKDLFKIDKQIRELVENKNSLTNEEIDKLYDLMSKKSLLDIEANTIAQEILEMINLASNNYVEGNNCNHYVSHLDAESFTGFIENESLSGEDYNHDNLFDQNISGDELIINLLHHGAYVRASELLEKEFVTNTLKNYTYNDRIIIRSLLKIFTNSTTKTFEHKYETHPNKEELESLRRYVKKMDFYGAYNYAVSSNIDVDILKDLIPDLFILYRDNLVTEYDLASDFANNMNTKDLNQARIDLINYKELLDKTSMGEKQEYQDAYSEMNKKYEKEKAKELTDKKRR